MSTSDRLTCSCCTGRAPCCATPRLAPSCRVDTMADGLQPNVLEFYKTFREPQIEKGGRASRPNIVEAGCEAGLVQRSSTKLRFSESKNHESRHRYSHCACIQIFDFVWAKTRIACDRFATSRGVDSSTAGRQSRSSLALTAEPTYRYRPVLVA